MEMVATVAAGIIIGLALYAAFKIWYMVYKLDMPRYREDFIYAYGSPTDVDDVWDDREFYREQRERQIRRYL